MRRALLAVVALLAALAVPARAAQEPAIGAAAWYAMGEDGSAVAAHAGRARRPMASITKLMTAIVTLERARLSDVVTVDPRAAGTGEATVFLRPGERLSVSDLLRAMLVRSANDAAEALALHVGNGSERTFVALMNAKARELDLTDTTYRNPHGLDVGGHASSARDTTLLVRYALGVPFIRETLERASVTLRGDQVFPTTDDLLTSWPPLLGGKTGHTAGAGWSEAAGARINGITVYGSVLGSSSRSRRNIALETLLEYAAGRFRRVAAIDSSRVYAEIATGYGRAPVSLVAGRSVVRTIPDRTPLVERVVARTSVTLPVAKGQRLGSVEIYAGDELVASAKLVAASAVSRPGLAGRLAWCAKRTVHHLWGLVT
jgi:serine-type D-Ala-D-Ala carboxypeptidase (penicillin-binding protein 5/6)